MAFLDSGMVDARINHRRSLVLRCCTAIALATALALPLTGRGSAEDPVRAALASCNR
jgi:hypothetical protein